MREGRLLAIHCTGGIRASMLVRFCVTPQQARHAENSVENIYFDVMHYFYKTQ
jgi:hypothetical protein